MIQSNIYLIENLAELSCKYRLYKMRGLPKNSPDYEKNMQHLIQILSRASRSPCVIIKENGDLFIAQPSGSNDLPNTVPLVGTQILIEKTDIERGLRFDKLNDNDAEIAKGFLQFALQGPLYNSATLWLPHSGSAFYHKTPDHDFRNLSDDVDMYKGFRFRLVILPDNKIGICVDISRKYISRYPLSTKIEENDFRRYKFKRCVYEYGKHWYEIRIEGLHDLNAGELKLPNGKSLFDDVHEKAGLEKSENLLSLPKDSSVLIYHTTEGAPRHVPSGLCRFTYKTDHPSVRRIHSKTIMSPFKRKSEIEFVVNHYFRNMKFQGTMISLSSQPYEFEEDRLSIPDLKFGNNVILSTSINNGRVFTTLEEIGLAKKKLLHALDAGFFVKKNLDQQYIIIPKSVNESYGKKLIEDLKQQMNRIYPQPSGGSYDPTIITYDDSVEKSIPKLGAAILAAVQNNFAFSGFGVVIIPRLTSTRYHKEDELANLVMRTLRSRGIFVSVMHTDVPSRSYIRVNGNGQYHWQLVDDEKVASRFKGYLSNVILNKILILNSCWPFVLANQLHTDITIGIDVKNNTAGFTFVYNDQTLRFFHSESDQKEQLGKIQLETKIYDFIKDEQSREAHVIKNIVIHRDGRLFQNEIDGIKQALSRLSTKGIIDKNYECNFVEIRKTSSIPVRFFQSQTRHGSQSQRIDNPEIGIHKIFGNQAFLCTTGRPYKYYGTASPLHVVMKEGSMDFDLILEDIFCLSNLTWTKIDYCVKVPISIKMTDIRLREIAGEYDEDALNFGAQEEESDE